MSFSKTKTFTEKKFPKYKERIRILHQEYETTLANPRVFKVGEIVPTPELEMGTERSWCSVESTTTPKIGGSTTREDLKDIVLGHVYVKSQSTDVFSLNKRLKLQEKRAQGRGTQKRECKIRETDGKEPLDETLGSLW